LRAFAVELVALEVLQRLARAKRAADATRGILGCIFREV
jgi:hypothetical protein